MAPSVEVTNSVHYTTRLLEMENFPLKMGSQTSICRLISEYMGYQLISTTINYNIYIYIIYSYMMIHDTSVYSFAFLECHDVSWVMTVPNTSLTSFSCISPRICASGRARPRESFDWKSLQNSAANRDAASPAGGTNRLPSPGPGSDCSGWCLSF